MPDNRSLLSELRETVFTAESAERDDMSGRPESRAPEASGAESLPYEYGGRKGPDPVRYGDWEKNGRCIDF